MVSSVVDLSIQEVIMDIARDEEKNVPTNAVTEDQDSTYLADDDHPVLNSLKRKFEHMVDGTSAQKFLQRSESAFLALPGGMQRAIVIKISC